jgi:Domain of unknown function (DUF4345)
MKLLSLIFFNGYVWTLIVAGALGVFSATIDHRILFHLRVETLAPVTAASLVSQYRFLRAIEAGFGIFAFMFRKNIFESRPFNNLFLGIMFLGVAARVVSVVLDGQPLPMFYAFLIFELVGGVVIYLYTRRTLRN